MDLPDESHIWRILLRGEKMWNHGEKRWPSELVWYYILFQSYTITNWNHITAPNWGPDNLLKGQFPQRGDPWPQACQQSSAGWLGCGCRGYVRRHIHMDTHSVSLLSLWLSHLFKWLLLYLHLPNIDIQNNNNLAGWLFIHALVTSTCWTDGLKENHSK